MVVVLVIAASWFPLQVVPIDMQRRPVHQDTVGTWHVRVASLHQLMSVLLAKRLRPRRLVLCRRPISSGRSCLGPTSHWSQCVDVSQGPVAS